MKKDSIMSAVLLAQEISRIQEKSINASTIRRSFNSQGRISCKKLKQI